METSTIHDSYKVLDLEDIGTKVHLEGGVEGLIAESRSGEAVLIHRQSAKQDLEYSDDYSFPIEMHQWQGERLHISGIDNVDGKPIFMPEGICVVNYEDQNYDHLDSQLRDVGL